jgi:D-tagatose-1,6-bisphosphate aldolase subunit GatZ/KbaZ
MTNIFSDIIKQQKENKPRGIYSVCSSHPFVIEAALTQAMEDKSEILIEATSNQVDQFGGYTGMTPNDFANYIFSVATRLNFPREKIILGGDHLGPNVWQSEPAESAMRKAKEQIAAYVAAGFKKIHLDASMHCADDAENLTDEIIADRTAELCSVAEEIAAKK